MQGFEFQPKFLGILRKNGDQVLAYEIMPLHSYSLHTHANSVIYIIFYRVFTCHQNFALLKFISAKCEILSKHLCFVHMAFYVDVLLSQYIYQRNPLRIIIIINTLF